MKIPKSSADLKDSENYEKCQVTFRELRREFQELQGRVVKKSGMSFERFFGILEAFRRSSGDNPRTLRKPFKNFMKEIRKYQGFIPRASWESSNELRRK